MTKGEVLKKYGIRMLRRDLNEEADSEFEEFCKVLSERFDDLFKDNEERSNHDRRTEKSVL